MFFFNQKIVLAEKSSNLIVFVTHKTKTKKVQKDQNVKTYLNETIVGKRF